jgi:YVTN family beta-propeller protein
VTGLTIFTVLNQIHLQPIGEQRKTCLSSLKLREPVTSFLFNLKIIKMKQNIFQYTALLTLASMLFIGCDKDYDQNKQKYEERVVVANMASGSISFVDANSNQVLNTLAIPGSMPGYVVYVPSRDKLYIGDRAQNKVHIVNPKTQLLETSIPVGSGVFHIWADGIGRKLWVVGDIDNTISVIDLSNNTVVKTISVGMKPHDIFLNSSGTRAYVTIVTGDPKIPDSIYMYSATDYNKLASKAVAKSPHLFHISNPNKLFVACQSGTLLTLDGTNLAEISSIGLVGAHGIFASPSNNFLYVANITGTQIYTVETSKSSLVGTPVNSLVNTPHNILVNNDGNKMFITHPGPTSSIITTYSLGENGSITPGTTITVGMNPFGLTYYKRKIK